MGTVLLTAGIIDLTGHRLALGRNRETRYTPGTAQRIGFPAVNAATLGTGFATRVGFASLSRLALATIIVWGAYGATRTGAVALLVLTLRRHTPLELLPYRRTAVKAVGLTSVFTGLGAMIRV